MVIQMEECLAHLLDEWMVLQKVPLKESYWVQLMEKHLELPMARLKAMSLVYSSADLMVMQRVLLME